MEMTNKMVDQMLASAAAQMIKLPQAAKGQKAEAGQEGKDFESMMQRKYQEAGKSGETEEVPQEAEPKAQTGEPAGEDPKAVEARQALAAAMLLQRPAEAAEEAVVQTQEEAVQAVPQAAEAVQVPETQVPQTDVELPQAQPQTEIPAAREGRETVQLPEQTLPQAETAQSKPVLQDSPAPQKAELETARAVVRQTGAEETGKTEEAPKEAPLFDQVDGTPFKVAAAHAKPLELNAPDAPEQLAEHIRVAVKAGIERVEMVLSPANLGKLTVEITRSENGVISVVLSAAEPKTAAMLERHAGNLQQLLEANTQSEVRLEVRSGEESQRQFLDPDDAQGRQNQQQQGQHRQERRREADDRDFIHQLRLGLIGPEETEL